MINTTQHASRPPCCARDIYASAASRRSLVATSLKAGRSQGSGSVQEVTSSCRARPRQPPQHARARRACTARAQPARNLRRAPRLRMRACCAHARRRDCARLFRQLAAEALQHAFQRPTVVEATAPGHQDCHMQRGSMEPGQARRCPPAPARARRPPHSCGLPHGWAGRPGTRAWNSGGAPASGGRRCFWMPTLMMTCGGSSPAHARSHAYSSHSRQPIEYMSVDCGARAAGSA